MGKSIRNWILAVFFVIASLSTSDILAWEGKVVGISDGDTITVLSPDKRQIKIRLYGVDCPEGGQDFGSRAKQFTSNKVFGKTVEIDPLTIDAYGRTVAMVEVDGSNLSQMLIESGMGWVFDKYCKMQGCNDWRKRQENAKSRKAGIWSTANPIPPWDYRHTQRKCEVGTEQTSSVPKFSGSSPSTHRSSSASYGSSISESSSSSGSGRVWVDSYRRKDGTQVKGYWRSK